MNKDYTEKDELKAVCMRCLTCWDGDSTLDRLADAILDAGFHRAAMNIKVGDKVRIKTEEEMLADGYIKEGTSLYNPQARRYFVDPMKNYCGQIVTIDKMVSDLITIKEDNGMCFYDETMIAKAIPQTLLIAKAIPQTLDEYIYSLPLEERAKWFVHSRYDIEYNCHRYFSIVTYDSYYDYGEALQATIKALNEKRG